MNKFATIFAYFSSHEKEMFARRLYFLLKANIPLLESLEVIKSQMNSARKKQIIESVIADVSNGKTLHASLANFRSIFGDLMINMIKVGEEGGVLEQNLLHLIKELKKRRLLKRKIISALIYPTFILAATLGLIVLLMVFVFPNIIPLLKSLGASLPFSTKLLIALSDFAVNYGLYAILALIICVIAFLFSRKLFFVNFFIDRAILLIPLFGNISRNYQISNIFRTIGLLLKSEVGMLEALKISAEVNTNLVYRQALKEVVENIIKGDKLSDQLSRYPRLFPSTISQLLAVGEATGELSKSFLYLSKFYEEEVDETTKNLSVTLEPLFMLLVGVIVGFVAVSIIVPIYDIVQHIKVR